MVFGFNKPSRSYATQQTSNYHPATGYPVGKDETRAQREREREERYQAEEARLRGGYGRGEPDSSSDDEPRVRRRDYGSASTVRAAREPEDTGVKRKSTKVKRTEPDITRSSHLDSTPFPTFRPTSSSSVLGTANKPKRKTQSIDKQFQQFSVLDLAPPAPGSTLNGGITKPKKKKKVVKVAEPPQVLDSQPSRQPQYNGSQLRPDTAEHMDEGSDFGSQQGTPRSRSPASSVGYTEEQANNRPRFHNGSARGQQHNGSGSRSPAEQYGTLQQRETPSPRLSPPDSDVGRPQTSVGRSYDAASPWTPDVRPPSRAASQRGFESPNRSSPGGTDSAGSSQLSVNRSAPARPIAGVSRSYKMVSRSGSRMGDYREEDYGEQEQDHEYETPDRELANPMSGASGLLAPPMLAIQPPTPLKEEEADSPLDIQGMRLEGVAEENPHEREESGSHEAVDDFELERPPVRPTLSNKNSGESSRASSQSPHTSIGTPPPPSDPNQPAYLKWDQQSQRWVPILGSAPAAEPVARRAERAESVISSTSAYSQASAPVSLVPVYPQDRRASLPAIKTNIGKPIRKGMAPGPSPLSRPSSPAHSRTPSLTGGSGMMLGPVIGETSFPARRMSIEPAYQLSPHTLTLLPELQEAQTFNDRGMQSEYTRSRPPSRAASIRSERMTTPRSEGLHRPASSFSLAQSFRPSVAFPAGYDINQRMSVFGPSENGDYEDDGESRYGRGAARQRPASVEGSYYAGSVYEGSQYGGQQQTWRRPEKLGQDYGLDTVSARGDPVPLLGADGTGEDGRGGYNAMVLPMGAYKPVADPTKNSNKLDARVLGMPSSSMSSVTLSGATHGSPKRRLSLTGFARPPSVTLSHLRGESPPAVTFSAHQAPPSKISSSQALVQVYAVALDRFDFDMVKEKSVAGSGAGKWVPGRTFVGRALEVGAEVKQITKGDMVIGLVDIKKSGTLAEFIVVDRRRLARTPYGSHLSLEQQACLPLLGVVAHRACNGITRGARALVLNAHEGVGALVCQELSRVGVHVVAQVPTDVDSAEDDAWDNGAREVVVDDPIVMLNGQHESGFEYVLDTYGGRKIYDASRRVLRSNGVYVTLFGDDTEHLAAGPQVKSSMHALRRAFVKKDKKAISYIHLTPGGAEIDVSGQDIRDILEESIMGEYQPKVGMVIPFERASDAFGELAATVAGRTKEESGSIVVRLMN